MKRLAALGMLLFFGVLMALVFTGCAGVIAPPVTPPSTAHPVLTGLNDGWHGVLPPDQILADCPEHNTVRTPQTSGPALQAFLDSVGPTCRVLALVETPDVALVTAFAGVLRPGDAIELGNELELGPSELRPSQYGEWIASAVLALQAAHYTGEIVLGGVYALTGGQYGTKAAILWGLDACGDLGVTCIVGVHLYNASNADLQWLRDLGVEVWVTETGFPTRCDPTRVTDQAEWLATTRARFATVPLLTRMFIYQRPDGPSCSDLDTYGLRDFSILHTR